MSSDRAQLPSPHPCDVLVISASVGAGHNQAARALVEGLRLCREGLKVTTVDALALTSRLFRAYYAGGFQLGMTRLPWAYGVTFRLTDRPHTPQRNRGERNRLWMERFALRHLGDFVIACRPRLILCTHFLAPPMIARLIAAGKVNCPQMIVGTDIEMHRWWYSEGVSHWFVPAANSIAGLARWGIGASAVTVTGIPIHPKWTTTLDSAAIRAEWRLPSDGPIVLLSGGTEFVCGPVVQIACAIVDACPRATVVVLAGRNKELLAELSQLPQARAGRIVPQGFTDRAHELVQVADLMITKPGGMTTAECLSKGTPMVFLKPVQGQESGNADYFQTQGAALITTDAENVIATVKRLLGNPAELKKLSENAQRLYRPATQIITDKIIQTLDAMAQGV